MKSIYILITLLLIAEPLIISEAYARRGRGSFSFSRSRSWGSSSKRSSRPVKKAPPKNVNNSRSPNSTTTSKTQSTGGYGSRSKSPNANPKLVQKSGFQKKMSANVSSQQAKASKVKYTEQKQQFKSSSSPVAIDKNSSTMKSIGNSGRYDRRTYYNRRDQQYSNYRTPGYAFNSFSSFGMWDAMFLWFMLDSISSRSNANAYYHHQNDPGMQKWREEADKLAKDNAELKTKLNALDQNVAKLQADGVKRDPNFVPAGMDPDLMLSEEALADLQPTLKICTGPIDGNYHYTGVAFAEKSGLDVELVPTAGSYENLQKIKSDECQAAIVQSDAIDSFGKADLTGGMNLQAVTVMYPEYTHLVCRRDSKVASISDLAPKFYQFWKKPKSLIIGLNESGSELTWKNFVGLNQTLKKVKISQMDPMQGMQAVIEGKADCMFSVNSLHHRVIEVANDNGKLLQLVDIDDGRFNDPKARDGKNLYEFDSIPSEVYPNIQDGFLSSSVESLVVRAVFVVRSEWARQQASATDSINETLFLIKPAIDKRIDPAS